MAQLTPRKRQPHVCMRCGKQDVRVAHRSDVLDFKGLTLEVDGLASTVCEACDHTWTTDGQERDNLDALKAAFAVKRDETRDNEGLLTGEQIQYAIDQLGLTRAEAAALFGGGPNAFGKYISGEVLQSFAMDRLIRLTVGFGEHAVRFLRKGRHAELRLNAAGYFVSSSARGMSITTSLAMSPAPAGAPIFFPTSSGERLQVFESANA